MLERHAPAKINLGLHVLRRRPDGYHDIETVFLRIPWADRITATRAGTLSMTCSDPALPTDARNLCLQAAGRLKDAFSVQAGAMLHLEKNVPYGAGLGSGSSDAAATLQLLNALWGVGASDEELHALGAEIGADVPFFLGPPAAHATGRGDVLTPLQSPAGAVYDCPFMFVVAVPPVEVATPAAYRMVTPREHDRPDVRSVVQTNDLDRWREDLVNDFEAPVAEAVPDVEAARALLKGAGAGYVSLSGSGSAVYGAFEAAGRARAAADRVASAGNRVWCGRAGAVRRAES